MLYARVCPHGSALTRVCCGRLRIHMKRRRKFHPVNMIRYVGWNPKRLLADWQTIEQYRSP